MGKLKDIKISKENWSILIKLKKEQKLHNMDEVINCLILNLEKKE